MNERKGEVFSRSGRQVRYIAYDFLKTCIFTDVKPLENVYIYRCKTS